MAESFRAEPFTKVPGDAGQWGFTFEDLLRVPDATITSIVSTTVVHEPQNNAATEDPALLTVQNAASNSVTYEELLVDDEGDPILDGNGDPVTRTVPIGKGVLADVAAGTVNQNYLILLVVNTSAGGKWEGVFPVRIRR